MTEAENTDRQIFLLWLIFALYMLANALVIVAAMAWDIN